MFLTSEAGNFLIIAIIAVFVIAFTLVIYLLISTKKQEKPKPLNEVKNINSSSGFEEINVNNNLNQETKEIKQNNDLNTIDVELKSDGVSNVSIDPEPFKNFDLIEEAKKRIDEIPNELNIQSPENLEEQVQNKDNLENNIVDKKEETNSIKEETDIESVLNQMQKDLNSLEKNEAEIARYEEEEEKNAIISYKELMKYKDIQDKDTVLEDKSKDEIKEVIKNTPSTVKKFKRSEFISPIFGYNDDSNVTYREIQRPPRKEKVKDTELEWESDRILKNLENSNTEIMEFEEQQDDVIDDTTRFLDELVDFRKKLD